MPVLRFNFRGAGLSEGVYDDGHGEQNDVRAALEWLELNFRKPILFAGFSFGANIGLRACCGDIRVKGTIGLGLPVNAEGREYTYGFLPRLDRTQALHHRRPRLRSPPASTIEQDPAQVAAHPATETVWIEGADHFFQGTPESPNPKLDAMKLAVQSWLTKTYGL